MDISNMDAANAELAEEAEKLRAEQAEVDYLKFAAALAMIEFNYKFPLDDNFTESTKWEPHAWKPRPEPEPLTEKELADLARMNALTTAKDTIDFFRETMTEEQFTKFERLRSERGKPYPHGLNLFTGEDLTDDDSVVG